LEGATIAHGIDPSSILSKYFFHFGWFSSRYLIALGYKESLSRRFSLHKSYTICPDCLSPLRVRPSIN